MRKAVRGIITNNNQLLVIERNKFGKIYYTLPGGGIEIGETPEIALRREIKEETGFDISSVRLVYVEDAGDMYGLQYVYLCDAPSGSADPVLAEDSIEAALNKQGKNLYQPMWLGVSKLVDVPFRTETLKRRLIRDLEKGFADTEETFKTEQDIRYTDKDKI